MGAVTGNVVSLDDHRRKKNLLSGGTDSKFFPYFALDLFENEPTEAVMRLAVIQARMKCYELASYATDITHDFFQKNWPVFIQTLDDYEQRAYKAIELHWKYKNGCRPGEMLALRKEKEELQKLLHFAQHFWFKRDKE